MVISLRIGDEEGEILKDVAKKQQTTVSGLLREMVMSRIETDYSIIPTGKEMVREDIKYEVEAL